MEKNLKSVIPFVIFIINTYWKGSNILYKKNARKFHSYFWVFQKLTERLYIPMEMLWNVYVYDFSRKSIVKFNIFDHHRFKTDIKQDLKMSKNKEDFAEQVRRHLFYYYGSKAEWEIVITSWVPHITMAELDRLNNERKKTVEEYNREPYSLYVNPDVGEKIDVYEQVRLNWDLFVDYVWSHKKSKSN